MTRTIRTETKLKSFTPKDKPYKLADGKVGGMARPPVQTTGKDTLGNSMKCS